MEILPFYRISFEFFHVFLENLDINLGKFENLNLSRIPGRSQKKLANSLKMYSKNQGKPPILVNVHQFRVIIFNLAANINKNKRRLDDLIKFFINSTRF